MNRKIRAKRRRNKTRKNLLISVFALLLLSAISFFAFKYTSAFVNKNKISSNHAANTNVAVDSPNINTDINKKDSLPVEQEQIPDVQVPVKKETSITISAVGDCTIGTDEKFNKSTSLPVIVQKNNNDPDYLFQNVADIFSKDQITIANLETTFTTSSKKRDINKKFSFKGDPSLAQSLVNGSIEAVNLSNNHIYDYGDIGFSDTVNTLKEYNISYFGEGYKWSKQINDVSVGFLGYQGWAVTNSLLNKLKKDISDLKSQNDIVIVSFHWGVEREYLPNDIQKRLAHEAIDYGADLVIGHHPHVIQSLEKYKDKYIAYSLGNFCFGGNSNPADKDSFILQSKFEFEDGQLKSNSIKVIPCSVSSVQSQNDYRPTPLIGEEKKRVLDKLNKLNINLGFQIDDNFR